MKVMILASTPTITTPTAFIWRRPGPELLLCRLLARWTTGRHARIMLDNSSIEVPQDGKWHPLPLCMCMITSQWLISCLLLALEPRILRSLRKHFWPSLPYSNAFVDASVLDDPASSESSSSPQHSHPPRSAPPHHMLLDKEDHQCAVEDSVDVVVLDRDFHEVLGDLALSTSMTEQTTTPATEPPDPVLSVAAPIAQQPSHAPSVLSTSSAASTAAGSVSGALPQPDSSPSARQCGLSVLRGIWSFLETRFPDPAKEAAYRRESWWMSKSEALTTVAFVFIAWIVLVATQSQPFTTFVKVLVCGVGAASVAPIIPLVAFDAPRKRPWTWQICLFAATWTLPYVTVLDIWHCNFYGSGTNHCTDRDFSACLLWATPISSSDANLIL